MKNYLILELLLLSLFISSCKPIEGPAVPGSTGTTYDMIVVCSDGVWNSSVGDTVRGFFGQYDSTMLMQEELYYLSHITEKTLNENKLFGFSKTILIIDIIEDAKPIVEVKDNLWAKPQRVFKITAPDNEAFITLFGEYQQHILEQFNLLEHDKLNAYFETALNKEAVKEVGQKFGYTFNVTTGFYVAKNYEDFMWLRSETSKTSTNLMIYTEDYTTENQLNQGYIILKRNLITKEHIPASIVDSYAKVSEEFPVTSRIVDLNGLFAVETRGAWDCYNDYMGGTFLSYTVADTVNNKVLTIDSFVYAPNKEKRVFMMQLEAMIYSIRRWVE